MKASQYALRIDDPAGDRRLLYSTLYRTLLDLGAVADRWDAGDVAPVAALGAVGSSFLVPEDTDEFAQALHYLLAPPGRVKTLYATVVVTMACNLRCVYCHEMGQIAGKRMEADTAEAVTDFLIDRVQQGKYRALCLYFYGGEPLMNVPVMERISARLRDAVSIPLSVMMPTNAVMLDHAMGRRLAALGDPVDLQLTLDGPRAVHDQRRTGVAGNYDRVMAAIDALPPEIRLTLRTNVDRTNIDAVPDLLDDLMERGILPGRARWYATPVAPVMDGSAETNASAYKPGDWPAAVEALWHDYTGRGLPRESIEIGDGLCGLPNRSVMTIDCQGELHPCTGLHSRGQGRGHVRDGAVPWTTKRPGDFASACRSCAYFPFCGGGCPATGCSSCAGEDGCGVQALAKLVDPFVRYRYGLA